MIYCPSALGSCRTCSCINPPAFNDWWSLRYTKGTTKSEHKNCVAREDIGTHNSVTDYETHSNCVATEDNETQADKEPQDDTGALQVVLMSKFCLFSWRGVGIFYVPQLEMNFFAKSSIVYSTQLERI